MNKSISKNNEPGAVILPTEEYEKMARIIEFVEHLEIAHLIKDREAEAAEIPLDDILKQNSIRRDTYKIFLIPSAVR